MNKKIATGYKSKALAAFHNYETAMVGAQSVLHDVFGDDKEQWDDINDVFYAAHDIFKQLQIALTKMSDEYPAKIKPDAVKDQYRKQCVVINDNIKCRFEDRDGP